MILYPHAKINLSLFITGRIGGGYHGIDTIFWPLPLFDTLHVKKAEAFSFSCSDKSLEQENNLICRAYTLMKEKYQLPALEIHLEKSIPYQAGLGGGSADGAAMILACEELFSLNMSRKEKEALGESLGADVPAGLSFLPQRGLETGAKLTTIGDYWPLPLLILKPQEGFSTAAMYRRWDEKTGTNPRDSREIRLHQEKLERAVITQDIKAICRLLENDFEKLLLPREEAILRKAKNLFGESGAAGSLLCGSGSGVFGVYESFELRDKAAGQLKTELPEGWRLLLPREREEDEKTDH